MGYSAAGCPIGKEDIMRIEFKTTRVDAMPCGTDEDRHETRDPQIEN